MKEKFEPLTIYCRYCNEPLNGIDTGVVTILKSSKWREDYNRMIYECSGCGQIIQGREVTYLRRALIKGLLCDF